MFYDVNIACYQSPNFTDLVMESSNLVKNFGLPVMWLVAPVSKYHRAGLEVAPYDP